MQMIKGVEVPNSKDLREEYEIDDKGIVANVDAKNILKLMEKFVELQDGYLFLIIEIPTNEKEEDDPKKLHKDVYYADGLTKTQILDVLKEYGYLFINDGLAQIGVGNHITNVEIMTHKYNVMSIYFGNDDETLYEKLVSDLGLKKTNNLVTAWNYFTNETPGMSSIIKHKGIDVYDALATLKDSINLYYEERRED